jgi:hypothetical protein
MGGGAKHANRVADRAVQILLRRGREEPSHIHVEHESQTAKFWLEPVRLERSKGFRSQDLNHIRKLVEENQALLRRKWDEYFEG